MTRRLGHLLLIAGLIATVSCVETAPETDAQEPHTAIELEVVVGPRTTRGSIAEDNLTAQIQGLRDAVRRGFAGPEIEDALIGALLVRAQFFGTWADFEEALTRSEARLRNHEDEPSAFETRARSLGAVHRFSDARAVLQLSPPSATIDAAMLTLDEAMGRTRDEVLAARQQAIETEGRTFSSLAALARALANVGRFEEADETYVEAASAYTDVSPFPIAWVAFSRGVMWGEVAGQPALARPLYEEAVRRLPGYVVANVHLAELEADDGEPQRAAARLASLRQNRLVDPEPDAVLGRISGDSAATERARQGYEEALDRYPEAVWDHAAEFFLSNGASAQRAHELAALNLEVRRTERAYRLAIQAALATDNTRSARELAASVPRPVHSVTLRELLPKVP